MTARQAKKVLRNHPYVSVYWLYVRGGTWNSAYHKMQSLHWRIYVRSSGRSATAGWRWGRWDPALPQDPKEPPF